MNDVWCCKWNWNICCRVSNDNILREKSIMRGFSMSKTGDKIGKYSLSIIECEIEKMVDVAK